jgi:hypothetical protein
MVLRRQRKRPRRVNSTLHQGRQPVWGFPRQAGGVGTGSLRSAPGGRHLFPIFLPNFPEFALHGTKVPYLDEKIRLGRGAPWMYFELRKSLLSRINRTRAAASATLDFISSGRWSILTPAISFICSNANAENAFGLSSITVHCGDSALNWFRPSCAKPAADQFSALAP